MKNFRCSWTTDTAPRDEDGFIVEGYSGPVREVHVGVFVAAFWTPSGVRALVYEEPGNREARLIAPCDLVFAETAEEE